MRGGVVHQIGSLALTQFLTFHLQVTAKKLGTQSVSLYPSATSGALSGGSAPLGANAPPPLTFLEALIMKHRNIHSKADRVQLKQKFDRQPPIRREAGISIRKTVKAFIYDVFEDGYLIGQLTKGK
jgi:hypothetical protein